MKKNFIIIISILMWTFCNAQQRWEHVYGEPGTVENFTNAIETYDQGFLLNGYSETISGDWLIKTDINGEVLWEKFVIWEENVVGSGTILQNPEGETYIVGSVWLNNVGSWPSITKLDECGNKIWCRVFIDENFEWAWFNDAVFLENGDIIALAHHQPLSYRGDEVFLYYITSWGGLEWKKAYATSVDHPLVYEPYCYDLELIDQEIYITGDCYSAYPNNPEIAFLRALFIGVDSSYNEKWILPFGMADSVIGEAKTIIPINDSVLMGVGTSFIQQDTNNILYPNGLLSFLTINGDEIGYNNVMNTDLGAEIKEGTIFDVERINDSLFITSARFGPEEVPTPNQFGEIIIDTSGNVYNFQTRENTRGGTSQVIKTADNKFAFGVNYRPLSSTSYDIMFYKLTENLEQAPIITGSHTYDSLCPEGIESGTIDLSDCMIIVNTEEIPEPGEYYSNIDKVVVKAVPNPATGKITFSLGNTDRFKELTLVCTNLFGQNVYVEELPIHQEEVTVSIASWPSGMYSSNIVSEGKIVGQCRFVVR
jgi:hypothetical protein